MWVHSRKKQVIKSTQYYVFCLGHSTRRLVFVAVLLRWWPIINLAASRRRRGKFLYWSWAESDKWPLEKELYKWAEAGSIFWRKGSFLSFFSLVAIGFFFFFFFVFFVFTFFKCILAKFSAKGWPVNHTNKALVPREIYCTFKGDNKHVNKHNVM